jgi:ATP-dependent DNA helicase RecG
MSATIIAATLNIAERTAQRDLKRLKSKEIIERIGPDKGGYWKIKDKNILQ